MLGGYMHQHLWVDLSTGEHETRVPDEALLRNFVGGYGVGARILFDRLRPGIDPLGPDNILGFVTGPLTGSPAPTGTRWTMVGKSPLTGGWGDANGSGYVAAALKRAGFDAIFFTGASSSPVYLLVEEGEATLHSADEIWGMDTYQIEDWAKSKYGRDAEAACIGPAGEKLSLISGIVHAKGRTAARSGLGAVMGSKRLKAIVVKGTAELPLALPEVVKSLRRKYLGQINEEGGAGQFYKRSGTPGYTALGAINGDSPTRNWGASVEAYPDADALDFEVLRKMRVKKMTCHQCPIGCWGISRTTYGGEEVEAHQPEYETGSAFGTLTLNTDYPAILKANELCNRYGLDSISAGTCVAFAIECFEHGLIGLQDTGGLRLAWGDHAAMIGMLEKIAHREDFGDVLADGVRLAAQRLGPEAQPFAIHEGGQELPLHDPRYEPGMAVVYRADATPGRHTQACQFTTPAGFPTERPAWGTQREKQKGRGRFMKEASCLNHTMNISGVCLFGYAATQVSFVPEFLSAVTGMPFTLDDMLTVGERVANMRQAFNVREGLNFLKNPMPDRAYGRPPLPDGPTQGVRIEVETMVQEHLAEMGWTSDGTVPTRETLERLGLADVADALWGAEP